jgi:hypothetical protein
MNTRVWKVVVVGLLLAAMSFAGITVINLATQVFGLLPVANGGHGAAPGGDDQMFVSSSVSAGAWKTLPTGAVKYTAATNTVAQAACGDLSNGAASCSTDTTNAANISSGVLATARLPIRFLRVTGGDVTQGAASPAFTDVTGLTTAVTNGDTVTLNCLLDVDAAATTTGVQIGVNGPSASAVAMSVDYFTSATAPATYNVTSYDATSAATGTFPVNSGGTTRQLYSVTVHVVLTATGTLALRVKNEIGSSTVHVFRGSSCIVIGATG